MSRYSRFGRAFALAGLATTLVFFQNCSNGFKTQEFSSTASSIFKLQSTGGGDSAIGADVFGDQLVIRTSTRMAGAIDSITWRGKEFIDAADHGRELQSAAFFSGDECWNPTEAGSASDANGPTSLSRLIDISAQGNNLQTTIQMAYWEWRAPWCTPHSPVSNDRVSKNVTIGWNGLPNVIDYQVTFTVADAQNYVMFEALTGYMNREFNRRFTYEPGTDNLQPTGVEGEQGKPVIHANADLNYAMGIYSPDLPQSNLPDLGYGSFSFGDTTKWNAVFRPGPVQAGSRSSFRMFVVIGTLSDVTRSMRAVHQTFHGGGTPVVTTTAVAQTNPNVFRVQGFPGAYYSNLNDAFCRIADADPAGFSAPVVATFPAGLRNDGPCGGHSELVSFDIGKFTFYNWTTGLPNCTRIYEDADPDTWSDNYLCGDKDYGLRWSQNGALDGMSCTLVNEPSEPAEHAWGDNYLCAPRDFGIRFSYAGPIPGLRCIPMNEPSDPHTWADNYLCAP